VRALAWARVPAWGLPPGGPVGSGIRGACLRIRWLFLKIITEQQLITPQRHRAHRDFTTGTISSLTILADCGLASPGSLSRALHPCLGSKARAPGCSARGRASGASSQFSRWWINLNMNHII